MTFRVAALVLLITCFNVLATLAFLAIEEPTSEQVNPQPTTHVISSVNGEAFQ